MKPLGTTTMCFPHVDEDTERTLGFLMDQASDFADFAERLCERTISESSSSVMEYLAFTFAYWLENYNLIDRLEAAGKVSDLAKPLLLNVRAERGRSVSWDEVKTSLMAALKAAPNDWIASHLYLIWRISTTLYFSEADVEIKPLDMISAAVNTNSDFQIFEVFLLVIEAKHLLRENRRKKAISLYRQALAIARKHDDRVHVAWLLVRLASIVKQSDIKQAIDILITARELSEELGSRFQIGLIQHQMGHIMGYRGEFNAAIEYQYDFKAISESLVDSAPIVHSFIAAYFNMSGNGEKALEVSEKAFGPDEAPSRFLPYARAQQAWALINLGRYTEAEEVITICQKLALKSGDTGNLAWYYMVEGLLDKAEKRFENAAVNFQKVLDFYNNEPTPLFQNICLLNLTEIEIDMLTDDSLLDNRDSSGPWMKRLEGLVQKNDLPGIAAQSLILKAKLRHRQGKSDDVRRILKEVQENAKKSSMRYLNDIIIAKFPDVIVT
ncbi:MAG: tetratricopeptide repeat protein [Candidatus Thorarchaeota archaeon]|jgi:tetratricopeptide (TPR) repeat protein